MQGDKQRRAMRCDLLLKNGRVINLKNNWDGVTGGEHVRGEWQRNRSQSPRSRRCDRFPSGDTLPCPESSILAPTSNAIPLTWEQRPTNCLYAARGAKGLSCYMLHYSYSLRHGS